ncbi:Protein CBG27027 [Caenorhabditis briggsae]|uniref:Protein CBG27027 n=1 Tax=Caenorhabditis briggsae TaxID=6238 RepID=B6IM92_CAEBR|nr:Protein CBG27027 [Caenorhabditis briggsae]CAS01022.1 Protein CBG27027 [Caenorhabditis briggsae]
MGYFIGCGGRRKSATSTGVKIVKLAYDTLIGRCVLEDSVLSNYISPPPLSSDIMCNSIKNTRSLFDCLTDGLPQK